MIIDLVKVGEDSYLYTKRAFLTSAWKDIHKGGTAIIIGNGNSLRDVPKSFLEKYPSFGVNYIGTLPFQPTYFVCMDKINLTENYKMVINTVARSKMAFLSRMYANKNGNDVIYDLDNVVLFDGNTVNFPGEYTLSGGTVIYTAFRIAYVMGFSTLLVVGCDRDKDMEHYRDDYICRTVTERLAKIQRDHLKLTGDIFKTAGRRIINLSLPSELDEYFERGRMDDYT